MGLHQRYPGWGEPFPAPCRVPPGSVSDDQRKKERLRRGAEQGWLAEDRGVALLRIAHARGIKPPEGWEESHVVSLRAAGFISCRVVDGPPEGHCWDSWMLRLWTRRSDDTEDVKAKARYEGDAGLPFESESKPAFSHHRNLQGTKRRTATAS